MRRALDGVVKLCDKQDIAINFDNYITFFEYLQTDCPQSNNNKTYLPLSCTPDKNTICEHQKNIWINLQPELESNTNEKRTFQYFVKKEIEKNGEQKMQFTVESVQANISFLLNFIEKRLPNIVHHRNLLLNFRSVYPKVLEALSTIEPSIDFSENLTLTLPEEIQSMYWGQAKTEVSVHPGIMKLEGNKVYHPYFSDDTMHDQAFVYVTLNKMLSDVEIDPGTTVIVTSDNCCSQYKSAQNFSDLQRISNDYQINILRIYGVAGHRKNEVDTVGGVAKIAIRTAISRGQTFFNSQECVGYLSEKFYSSENPSYRLKVIEFNSLEEERTKARYMKYPTIKGSASFQVILFEPNADAMKVAPYLSG